MKHCIKKSALPQKQIPFPVSDPSMFEGKSRTFRVGGKTYVVGWNQAVSRARAQQRCVRHGGKLAELYDQERLDAVR